MQAAVVTTLAMMGSVALGGMHTGFQHDMGVRTHGSMSHRNVHAEADSNASASAGASVSSSSSSSQATSGSSSSVRSAHRNWVRAHIQAIRRCQLLHGREQGRCLKNVNAELRTGIRAHMKGSVTVH